MTLLVDKCMNKTHNVNGYVSHSYLSISSSESATTTTMLLMYDGCVKCSHLHTLRVLFMHYDVNLNLVRPAIPE